MSNESDPNYNRLWGFCEFTFNSIELFVNISYVDFVSLPIRLNLLNTSGVSQSVMGIPANGLQTVSSALIAQGAKDGKGWEKLVVRAKDGSILRALSPNTGIVLNSELLKGYYDNYVNQVWNKYTGTGLRINTQAQWGTVEGRVTNGILGFGAIGGFGKPSARDVFSCSTGPFAVGGNAALGNIAARVSAGFNRRLVLSEINQVLELDADELQYAFG